MGERIAKQAQDSTTTMMPQVGDAAELLRLQVFREQQLLMTQLQNMRFTRRGGDASSSKGQTCSLGIGLDGHPSGRRPTEAEHRRPKLVPAGKPAPAPSLQQPQACATSLRAKGNVARLQQKTLPPPRCPPGQVQAMTLSMSLQLLSKEDSSTLFVVRCINKLGFKAAQKLKAHFAWYGHVVRVLVAHSTLKQTGNPQLNLLRRRPSSLGFIHMARAEAVRQVLLRGEEHEVDGCMIRVQQFQRQLQGMSSISEGDKAEEEDSSDEKLSDDQECSAEWDGQQSAVWDGQQSTGSSSSGSSSGSQKGTSTCTGSSSSGFSSSS